MPVSISEAEINNYTKDGALLIKNLLTPDEISDLREGIDANISHPSSRAKVASKERDPGWFFEDFCNWQENPAYKRIIFESAISEVAAKLFVLSRFVCSMTTCLLKKPERNKGHHGIMINRTIILKECKISVFGFRLIQCHLNGH